MKSNEMKDIIKEEVTNAWEKLSLYTQIYGIEHELTSQARAKWIALDNLWQRLFEEDY